MTVIRYDFWSRMGPHDSGDYVAYADYEKLESKLADYTRRSECGESKLDWIERGEQILELEAKLTTLRLREGEPNPTSPELELIREAADTLAEERAKIDHIISTYDAYRKRGVCPAPKEYADVVASIDAARREKP